MRVTIATSSASVNTGPPGHVLLTRRATFSSHSRFLLPDGDQSDPRPIGTPFAFMTSMCAVLPYSSRFESGDHTI